MNSLFVTLLFTTLLSVPWKIEASTSENTDNKNDAVFKVYNNLAVYQSLYNKVFISENDLESTKQLPFTNPCICENFKCSCCAGIRVIGFGFDRMACAELTYEPLASVVDFNILMNNVSVFTDRLSTHNRQVCIPIIPITLVGPFDICVRLYDMNVVEQRLHGCLAMMGRVSQYPVVVLQFNCMEMGPGGVGLTRPIGSNYNESALYPSETFNITTTESSQLDSDVFDQIIENAETSQQRNLNKFQKIW